MSAVDSLDVYMHGARAGTLERLSQARLRFAYAGSWVAEQQPPLSLGLPVRLEPYEHEDCAPFFEGLLPEGDFLKAIARTLHVSATNPFQLLTELGGECAGAISVSPSGGPEPGQDPRPPRWLGEDELGALLADLPRRPLIAAIDEVEDGGGFRLSLAGAQNKVGVLTRGDEVGLSHGRPPTTGILKAPIPHVRESVANEAFCMALAAHVDLDVAVARPRIAAGEEYLLVDRYDRDPAASDGRIHQEDFCQALGLVPAVKYEKEGGPTVADSAGLIRRRFSAPVRDLMAFLDALLFNFVIANYDAHSKNYSLLFDTGGSIRLAPLYDLISTAVFDGTDRKLAMRYGGENRPEYLRGRHLDRLAKDLGVKPALVRRRAIAMHERAEAAVEGARQSLPAEFQDRPILEKVIGVIGKRGEALARRAGEAPVAVEAPVEDAGNTFEELDQASDAVVDRISDLSDDLDDFIRTARADADLLAEEETSGVDFEASVERMAARLEGPAQRLKLHGRQLYDGVVELDSAVERILRTVRDQDELDPGFPGVLEGLAGTVDEGFAQVDDLYAEISKLERVSSAFRAPVRNMRSGLRDTLDARAIISAWKELADSLRPAE